MKYGYNVEVHHVVTDDGYILELHRIIGSPKNLPRKGKQPVLLMHGLLDSSATWVMMGPQKGLGKNSFVVLEKHYVEFTVISFAQV